MILLVALAAAEPVRCTATWATATVGCQVRGPVRAEATAGSEAAARARVLDQLVEELGLFGIALRLRSPMLAEADFAACPTVAPAAAMVSCFPEPALQGKRFCFADLAAPECWTTEVLHFEAAGVRALDQGRDQMCARVDARLVELDYTDLEWRRASCRARCEAETRVRCPAD